MKTTYTLSTISLVGLSIVIVLMMPIHYAAAQASIATPLGIGRNCGTGNATTNASDSVKVMNYTPGTNQLTNLYTCKPSLGVPGYSPYSGSIAFNPQDQKLYYIETTNGLNSYIYRWSPVTCPTGSMAPAYSYTNRYIVGLDFNPVTGNGYQLEFNNTAPYVVSLRQVNFGTGTFGPSDTLILPPGKNIYQQSGDIVFTPLGDLYFAFDNKMFKVDYSNYGPGVKLNTSFIDTLMLPSPLLGLAYVQGKFLASIQNGANSSCAFKDIDISTGKAVITNANPPAGAQYTATDMASLLTGLGVAKKVSSVSAIGPGTYNVQYDIKIKNFGNTNLNNVQLTDSVAKLFGPSFTSASVAAVGTLSSGLTLNRLYNGNTDCNIFVGGATSTMAATPPDSSVVRVTVILTNPNMNFIYLNSAKGYATSVLFSKSVADSSNNDARLRADLNNNSIADDAGENVPTPLRLIDYVFLANKIVDFNAVSNGDEITLRWLLENMQPGLTIQIQKSTDGIHFEKAAEFESADAVDAKEFNWVDKQLSLVNFYRLELTRPQTEALFSQVIAIGTPAKGPAVVHIFPNPFQQAITFQITLQKQTPVAYQLYDLNSRLITNGQRAGYAGENNFTIGNLESLPPGPYLLKIMANGQVINKVIIKTQ